MYRIIVVLSVVLSCAVGDRIKAAPLSRVKTIAQAMNPENIIDSMDSTLGWSNYGEKGARVNLSSAKGKYGQSLKVSYDMVDGGWVAITKNVNRDLSSAKRIRFWVKGEGSANSLEIKLEDFKQTNYGYVLKFKSNIGAWMVVDIPISKFEYWWGSNKSLNFKNVKSIHFAISKKDGDQGGSGKVYLDQLEMDR